MDPRVKPAGDDWNESFRSEHALERLRAGNDLDQLFGDHRLAGAVITKRLLADHFSGIAGGVVHRAHLGAVEGGVVLEKSTKDLHRNIPRQQLGENLLLIRLVL